MKNDEGQLIENYLDSSVRIICPPQLVPAPGQYLLAHPKGTEAGSPLAVPVFFSDSAPNGFRSAPLSNSAWHAGTRLNFRGPLGHGFSLPSFARKVALIAFDETPARLRSLISMALKQDSEVVLVCDTTVDDVPEAVEVQPLQAISDIYGWADYAAIDLRRENLIQIRERFGEKLLATKSPAVAQVLVRAPMPCGAIAECGVCTLKLHHRWKMICKDGPVFDLKELFNTKF